MENRYTWNASKILNCAKKDIYITIFHWYYHDYYHIMILLVICLLKCFLINIHVLSFRYHNTYVKSKSRILFCERISSYILLAFKPKTNPCFRVLWKNPVFFSAHSNPFWEWLWQFHIPLLAIKATVERDRFSGKWKTREWIIIDENGRGNSIQFRKSIWNV